MCTLILTHAQIYIIRAQKFFIIVYIYKTPIEGVLNELSKIIPRVISASYVTYANGIQETDIYAFSVTYSGHPFLSVPHLRTQPNPMDTSSTAGDKEMM